MHVGLPAVEREGFAAAHDRRQFGIGQGGVIDLALRRVGPGKPQIFGALDAVHVGDVALVAAAQFDAERGDQHQTREAGGRADHHLGRDPAAEIGADQHRIIEAEFGGEIEVEVGKVIDPARAAIDQRRVSVARMQRCDDTITSCEQIEPRPLGRQPLAGVQEQQGPPLAALDQFEGSAGQ